MMRAVFGIVLAVAVALAGRAAAEAPAAKPPAAAKQTLLDLNAATKPELMALKGIGDKRADEIIKGRPYKGKDELVQKKLIPQAVYDGIKDKVIARQK